MVVPDFGVADADADEDDCDLLELGVEVETGPELLPGVLEVP